MPDGGMTQEQEDECLARIKALRREHDPLCACDECFDKPVAKPTRFGRPPISQSPNSMFREARPTTPVNNVSPLNEAVRDNAAAFMGRKLSADELKIIDFCIMDLTRYERVKRNGDRTVKEKTEIIIVT